MKRIAVVIALGGTAHAGGMFLPIRGVNGLEHAGATVAGAEDADALFDNPAGLAHLEGSGHRWEFSIDGTYVNQAVDYTRIDSGGNVLPMVSSDYPGITAPSLAIAYALTDKLTIAGGFYAPYAGIGRYSPNGPERYTSASLAESLFVTLVAGASWKLTETLRVGATVQNTISKLESRVTLSGCPAETICAPEDPDFDADTKLSQLGLFAPAASGGIQWDAHPMATLGAFVQTPTRITNATGTLETRLPSSSFFDGASVQGNEVTLELNLPAIIKFGAQLRPMEHLNVDVAMDIELWSIQESITIEPHDVSIQNSAGVGTYNLGKVDIARNYHNSYAPSIALEWHQDRWQVGAGYSYETAAAPAAYVSTLTVDSAKHIIGVGGGYNLWGWNVSAAFGYVKLKDVNLALGDAKVGQLSPIRDQPDFVAVNAGDYRSHYVLFGARLAHRF